LVGGANTALDTTPRLVVPDTGTAIRTRLVNVQGAPNIRVIVTRLQNTTTALSIRLVARTGISNGSADVEAISPAITLVPADIVGTVTTGTANVVGYGMVAAEIVRTAGVGDTHFKVQFIATST
jgi:hypothetical protein